MLRLADNPPRRFPEARSLAEDTGRWVVAHVKSRQEKAFAHDLQRRGISYYLPQAEKRVRRRDNGKWRKSWMPLFPGYVAVAPAAAERDELFGTRRLAGVLPVEDQAGFVAELGQVERVIAAGARLRPVAAFAPGERVCVTAGPLMGLHGEVLRQKNETAFIIRVHMFQRALSVELDELYLESA